MTAIGDRRRRVALSRALEAFAVENLSRQSIKTRDDAAVRTPVKSPVHREGSLHVIALARMHPCNRRVRVAGRWRSNISAGARADGAHRTQSAVGAGQIDQVVGDNRSGHGNVAASVKVPKFLAVGEVVAAAMMPAINDDLATLFAFENGRTAPRRNIAS